MSIEYFKKLYAPVILAKRLGDPKERRRLQLRLAGDLGRKTQTRRKLNLNGKTREELKQLGSKGGRTTWANYSEEQRRIVALRLTTARRVKITPARHKEISRAGGRAAYAGKSPEQRAVETARLIAARRLALLRKRWPFPL